jgi:hypothetical protein
MRFHISYSVILALLRRWINIQKSSNAVNSLMGLVIASKLQLRVLPPHQSFRSKNNVYYTFFVIENQELQSNFTETEAQSATY